MQLKIVFISTTERVKDESKKLSVALTVTPRRTDKSVSLLNLNIDDVCLHYGYLNKHTF